jgi:hypothetical protein
MIKYGWLFWEFFVSLTFASQAYQAFAGSDKTMGWVWIWILLIWWRTNFTEWRNEILVRLAELRR